MEFLKFLEKKNGILEFFFFFLIFFIKNFFQFFSKFSFDFFFGDFCVLRAIFCDCQTPLRENKLELILSEEKKCLVVSRVVSFWPIRSGFLVILIFHFFTFWNSPVWTGCSKFSWNILQNYRDLIDLGWISGIPGVLQKINQFLMRRY